MTGPQPSTPSWPVFREHLLRDSARVVEVLGPLDPTTRVPTCPDWDAADLLWHLTEVQLFWGFLAARPVTDDEGVQEAEAAKPARPSSWPALQDLARSATAGLVDALQGADDDEVWTWSDDRSRGFVRRRQVHEALVHRVDAELTAGVLGEVDAGLAADGVDELLRRFWSGAPAWATVTPSGGLVELRATDVDRSWLVQPGRLVGTSPRNGTTYDEPTGDVVEPGAGTGDPVAVVAGPAAALDLWLWSRGPADALERSGDPAALAAVQAVVDDGVD